MNEPRTDLHMMSTVERVQYLSQLEDHLHTARTDASPKADRMIAAARVRDYDTADRLHRELQADWQLLVTHDRHDGAAELDSLLTHAETHYQQERDKWETLERERIRNESRAQMEEMIATLPF